MDAVADTQWIGARYDRLVIGSGDGAFGDVVEQYRSIGIPVGVVSRVEALSMSLRYKAHFLRLMAGAARLTGSA